MTLLKMSKVMNLSSTSPAIESVDSKNIRRNCMWVEDLLDEEMLALLEPVRDLYWYEGLPRNRD